MSDEHWFRVEVEVLAGACDVVAGILLEVGAEGIREDYPELGHGGPAVAATELAPPPPPTSGRVEVSGFLRADPAEAPRIDRALREGLAHFEDIFPGLTRAPARYASVPPEDWGRAWREHFEGVHVGRALFVRPSWIESPGDERTEIVIDPSMAFGTGTHFTTAACLELLEDELRDRDGGTVVDLGTGTGILAIAAVKLGADSVVAVDVDGDALIVAARNLDLNGIGARISLRAGSHQVVDGRHDVVLANILAPVLCDIADDLAAHVAHRGAVICSGLLVEQEDEVRAALTGAGLEVTARLSDDEWVALQAIPSAGP
jgi:ribosomal protein L11 methyltransferase